MTSAVQPVTTIAAAAVVAHNKSEENRCHMNSELLRFSVLSFVEKRACAISLFDILFAIAKT